MKLIILNCFLTYVMINWSIFKKKLTSGFIFLGVLVRTLCSSQFCEFELDLDLIYCLSSCIMSFNLFMHHIVLLVLYFFMLTYRLPLVLFLSFFPILLCALGPYF